MNSTVVIIALMRPMLLAYKQKALPQ